MKLFISYAREDVGWVKQVVDIMRSGGHDPWFDYRLLPGQDWQVELLDAINACDAFVYMLTPESVASEWCQWEYAKAVGMGKPVVPVLLKNCIVPQEISRFQYADFSNEEIPILANGIAIAHLIGGLTHIASLRVFPPTVIQIPPKPSGIPAQAVQKGQVEVAEILLPLFEWIHVPGGEVILDAGGYVPEGGKKYSVEAFAIAKYPITNAQYQVFSDAEDGYRNVAWWKYSIEAEQWRAEQPTPKKTDFEGDDLPRTNVCWYDAVAFCRWLSDKSGQKISLPTEQQWQWVAQGKDKRIYPWGDKIDSNYCNYNDFVGQTTSVTQYPKGATPEGVMHMGGNVWEWCLSEWGTDNISIDGNNQRVYRGGSWSSDGGDVRAASRVRRFGGNPDREGNSLGFRVVHLY